MALNLSTLTDSSTSAGILDDLATVASNLDLVASLENLVSGGPNATQTTSTYQPRAHVPVGDGHLYLSGVSGNYASAPTSTDYDNLASFTIETEVSLTDWNDTSDAQAIMARAYSWEIRVQDGGKLLVVNRNSSGSQYNIISTESLGLTNGTLAKVRVMRDGYDWSFYKDDGTGFVQVGSTVTTAQNTNQVNTRPIEVGAYNNGTNKPATGSFKRARLWDNASPDSTDPILDIDFSTAAHKASSFICSTGQTITIHTSGDDPATIVRKSFMRMDIVDDEYEFTTDAAVNGTIVVATLEGTYSANISLAASTQYDLQARGVASLVNRGFLKNVIGYLITPTQLSDSEITNIEAYFVDKGAAARSAFGSVTSFTSAWQDCSSLTSFPALNTSSGTSFTSAWQDCTSLTSFPAIDTSSGTSFFQTWRECSSLTSFPAIDTSSGTRFDYAWFRCSSLTSFPSIDTSSGTSFYQAWRDCSSLTSFPLIDTSSGTSFYQAWRECSSLTSFPLINTSSGTSFSNTWYGCNSLTSFPLINASSVTLFGAAWYNCSSLTSFPLIDTSSGTNFAYAWYNCSSLTSFPLINTSLGTNFGNTWLGCNSLTSFPLINTSSGTNFGSAWRDCNSLTSFPLINTSSGTNFGAAWYSCSSLTSFPLIDTSSGTGFGSAWYNCNSLTSFPANFFDSWSPASLTDGVFNYTWDVCSSLTAQSVENILTSLDTSGIYGTNTGLSGGTQLADHTIDIDYDGTTLSSATTTAITNLKSKNWAISINSVIQ